LINATNENQKMFCCYFGWIFLRDLKRIKICNMDLGDLCVAMDRSPLCKIPRSGSTC